MHGLRGLCFLLSMVAASAAMQAQTQESLAQKSEHAKALMGSGRFAEAALLYEQLNKAVPNNPGLLLNLGMALHMSGQDARAVAPLESAVRLAPALAPAQLFLGGSYIKSGQPAKAMTPLRRFLTTDPSHREARQMIADAAMSTENYSEAVVHLRKLVELEGGAEQPGPFYAMGRAYEAMAANSLTTLEKIAPQSGYWFALMGDSRSQGNQNRAAFYFYSRAVEKLPKHRGLHAQLAGVYRRTGHEDWASREDAAEKALGTANCKAVPRPLECDFREERFERMLQTTAQRMASPEALYWRIRACDALARRAFRQLAALPESPDQMRFLAELARDQGRHQDAVSFWRKSGATDERTQLDLATSLASLRDYAGAQEILDKLLPTAPDEPEVNFLQGDVLLAQQQAEKAVPFLDKAVKGGGAYMLPARATYARALIAVGQATEAIPHLKAALPADTDGSLHFQLARALQAAGRNDEAKVVLAKYQKIRAELDQADFEIQAPQAGAPAAAPPAGKKN